MRKKRAKPLLTAGTSTLLLIFVSLCLLTFAVLSFLSARADQNLSRKMAQRTTDYYEASNKANQRLAEIDELLADAWKSAGGPEDYYSRLTKTLEGFSPEQKTVSFDIPVAGEQLLFVDLRILYPEPGGSLYEIICWKTVNTADWTPDTRQNVYVSP